MESEKKRRSTTRFMGVHTIHLDGDRYMTRAWFGRLRLHIMYRGDHDPDCHDHPWAFWTFPLTPYVEEVVAPKLADVARVSAEKGESFVCEPSRATRYRQVVPSFRISYRPALHTHRILGRAAELATYWSKPGDRIPSPIRDESLLRPGKIITIVWRGRTERHHGWGFVKNTDNKWCWQPWKRYVQEGGKHVPCE